VGPEVLSFPENRGLPVVVAAGYEYAARKHYAYCGRVDADGQHPAAELHRLLERVRSGECDVAVGSRFISGDGYEPYRYKPSPARRLGTSVLRRALRLQLGRPFADATSGMYAAAASAFPFLAQPYTTGAPEVQGLLRLADAGLVVEEVPVNMRSGRPASLASRKKAVSPVLTLTDDPALPLDEEAPVRLVVVLGHPPGGAGLHPVCEARVLAAAEFPSEEDTVPLSGRPEVQLMLKPGPARLPLRRRRRVTAETAVHVAHLARELGAEEVVAVTSWWHCRRTGVLFRRALSGTGIDVRTFGAPRWSGRLLLREAAAYAVLPLHLRRARV
jgi:hypothetical protein